jgi:uncharacterized protein YbcC (UPF0753/DUF2309 family)
VKIYRHIERSMNTCNDIDRRFDFDDPSGSITREDVKRYIKAWKDFQEVREDIIQLRDEIAHYSLISKANLPQDMTENMLLKEGYYLVMRDINLTGQAVKDLIGLLAKMPKWSLNFDLKVENFDYWYRA